MLLSCVAKWQWFGLRRDFMVQMKFNWDAIHSLQPHLCHLHVETRYQDSTWFNGSEVEVVEVQKVKLPAKTAEANAR